MELTIELLNKLIAQAKQKKYIALPEHTFMRLTDYSTLKINSVSNEDRDKLFKHFNKSLTSRRKVTKLKAQVNKILEDV